MHKNKCNDMKITFLTLILISAHTFVNAQTYVPIPYANGFWNEIKLYQGQCDPPDFCKYTYFFQGDTVIDAESYHKLYSNDSLSASYVGGMREIDKRIYFYYKECSNPVLLYDFGLNVGDSIALSCELCYTDEPLYMKVTSIDSVLIGDMSYRKRINFDYGPAQPWIEGIGSTAGLLYPYYSCFTCTCFLELVCFKQDVTTLYLNEDLVPCFNYSEPENNLDPASEWRVDYYMAEPGYFYNSFYKDFIDGDTMINALRYYKVYSSGYSYLNWAPPEYYNYFEHQLHGLLREENGKWYTLYEGQDTVLFDFTLDIHDTVYSPFTFFVDSPIIVSGIDSIMVDGEYRRRLHLSPEYPAGAQYIIESIGATSGLFENMAFFEWGSDLACFAKNGVSLWGESEEECDLAVNINENKNISRNCAIYPNPAKDYTNIFIPSDYGKVKITIIDSYGKIAFLDFNEDGSLVNIPLNTYQPGLYLILIGNDSQKHTVKLLVQ
jgi:hypothetical protein